MYASNASTLPRFGGAESLQDADETKRGVTTTLGIDSECSLEKAPRCI